MTNRNRKVAYVVYAFEKKVYLSHDGIFREFLNQARFYEHEAFAWNAVDNRKISTDKVQVLPVELTLLRTELVGEA